jgi:hypothetical protein
MYRDKIIAVIVPAYNEEKFIAGSSCFLTLTGAWILFEKDEERLIKRNQKDGRLLKQG